MIEISSELTGTSPAIRALQADIEHAAACDAKVLITGDTGTGKEVTARQIHARSQRRAHESGAPSLPCRYRCRR